MQDSRLRFDSRTPFSVALDARVDSYFQETGRARFGGAAVLVKTATLFAWLFAAYAVLMLSSGSWLVVVLVGLACGLATAGLGMAVQHDGGHLAYSENCVINRAAASVLDFLGASSYVWGLKHNVVHHTYPNVEGTDDDIDVAPFARMAPGQPHSRLQRWQHLYMWPLYGFLTAKWFLFDDFRDLVKGHVGKHTLRPPRGLDLLIFVGGKLVHLAWALVIPVLVLGWAKGLVFYAVFAAACGVVLAVVFQLAHCVEEAEFVQPERTSARDFATHQLSTTVDFARHNKLLGWYVGGLNFQAVHHLFPRVSHVHYPALAGILEQTAGEFGVQYRATDSLWIALRSHYRWLRRMGGGELRIDTTAAART